MPLEEFIIWVYCWVDENHIETLGETNIRKRRFEPALSDIEVITMEIVGEFISFGEFIAFDTDKGLWKYFKTHRQSWFPKLSSRSSFAKKAANLWHVKKLLQVRLSSKYKKNSICHIVDGFQITTAHFKRAKKSQNFKCEAGYGYCASKSETYYGFKGHFIAAAFDYTRFRPNKLSN